MRRAIHAGLFFKGSFWRRSTRTAHCPSSNCAVQVAPQEAGLRLRLGRLLVENGQLDRAQREFEAALVLDATRPQALVGLARIAALQGQPAAALDRLALPLSNPSTQKAASQLAAELHARLGHVEQARDLRRSADRMPVDRPFFDPFVQQAVALRSGRHADMERGKLLIDEQQSAAAVRLLESTSRNYPSSAPVWLLLGRAQAQRGNRAAAEASLRRALELDPGYVEAWVQLGAVLSQDQDKAAAIECFRKALELRPGDSNARFDLAVCQSSVGDLAAAREDFEAVIRLRPDFPDAYIGLGEVYLKLGQPAAARRQLERALELQPDDARARGLLKNLH